MGGSRRTPNRICEHTPDSTTEGEALAVVYAVNKFRDYIEGSKIRISTDHHPLRWLLSQKSPTGRLDRWAPCLQGYDQQIDYTPGKYNVVGDTLSRPNCLSTEACSACIVTIDLPARSKIRSEELKDPEVQKIIHPLEEGNSNDTIKWCERGYVMTAGVLYR